MAVRPLVARVTRGALVLRQARGVRQARVVGLVLAAVSRVQVSRVQVSQVLRTVETLSQDQIALAPGIGRRIRAQPVVAISVVRTTGRVVRTTGRVVRVMIGLSVRVMIGQVVPAQVRVVIAAVVLRASRQSPVVVVGMASVLVVLVLVRLVLAVVAIDVVLTTGRVVVTTGRVVMMIVRVVVTTGLAVKTTVGAGQRGRRVSVADMGIVGAMTAEVRGDHRIARVGIVTILSMIVLGGRESRRTLRLKSWIPESSMNCALFPKALRS